MEKKMSALLVAMICFGIVASSPVLAKMSHKKMVKSAKPAITTAAKAPVAPVKK